MEIYGEFLQKFNELNNSLKMCDKNQMVKIVLYKDGLKREEDRVFIVPYESIKYYHGGYFYQKDIRGDYYSVTIYSSTARMYNEYKGLNPKKYFYREWINKSVDDCYDNIIVLKEIESIEIIPYQRDYFTMLFNKLKYS